ncbi:DUF4153 domain-containing protein [Bacteroides nordii]|uniref:DUF4153 domain-containing protein n=1 Tax=Bacteroides nordii TaxID=291645 RepID=UPI00241DF752|nr:DUF4153 domain-containing protein [Bacteroides nordii]MBD9111112.1 DUF4153 domain-containing protein [Bacteroides nordii]
MKINLSKVGADIISALKKYPVEALLGLLFFVFFCIEDQLNWESSSELIKHIRDVMSLFPAFMVLVYSLHQLLYLTKGRILYYLSVLLPLLFLWVDLSHFVFTISYTFTLILAFFILLACKCKWENLSFARNCMQTFVSLIFAFFIGHLLALAVWGLYSSVVYIFNMERYDFPEYIYMFCLFVVIPLLYCHLQEKESEEHATPRFMEIIINYILSPAVIVYTAILYIYFITIAIHWELPKGGIGYMVLALAIFAMAGHMFQLLVSKNIYGWFYSHFSWIAIPPLILFWVGTIERITTYSFTASRVYLFISGILMTFYIFFLFSRKIGNYQLMAVVSSICIVILTFIPGISARSIGIHSQKQRLERYISRLDMLDSVTHKLKQGVVFNETDSLRWKDARELEACYSYLEDETGSDCMKKEYGECDISTKRNWHYMSPVFPSGINTEGYTRYYPMNIYDRKEYVGKVEDGVIKIRRVADDKVIISRDINAYMNSHRAWMQNEVSDSVSSELFITCNDSCMLVLSNISYESGVTLHCTNVLVDAIFIK